MLYGQTSIAVSTHRWFGAGKVVTVCGVTMADSKSGESHLLCPAAPAARLPPINARAKPAESAIWFVMPSGLPFIEHKTVYTWFKIDGLDLKRADMLGTRGCFGGFIGILIPLDAHVAGYPQEPYVATFRVHTGQEF